MITRRCQSAPLVEARRDGRLDDRERTSLERHLYTCAACRALDADLARLADLARAPLRPASRLEHTRGRMHLLQAAAVIEERDAGPADRGTLGGISAAAPPARAGWHAPLAAAAVALLIAAVGASRSQVSAAPAGGEPSAHEAGEAPPPAGEAPPQASETPPAAQPADTARAEAPPASEKPAAPAAAKRSPASSKRVPVGTAAAKEREDDLAAGVGSLGRGDFGEAAERLRVFQEKHPNDARAEDAAFLSILALDRAGKREAAATAARSYLARYPNGYRRAEAEAIAGRQD
jgi:hypothetical protein